MNAAAALPVDAPSLPRAAAAWELTAGGLLLAVIVLLAWLGPSLAANDPRFIDLEHRFLAWLSAGHPLGTDQLGRDSFARLLHGLRWSLSAAACATAIACALGTVLGLIAARNQGAIGTAIPQITAFAQSFPVFVLAVSFVALFGNGFKAIVLILGCVTWPMFCRVVQAEAASLHAREYVLAAQMLQMSRARLYVRHILPALVPSLSVLVAFHFADMLIAESALAFLGIGAPLGTATWGSMLQESRAYLVNAPQLLLAPAAAIVTLVITANLIGDGLRRRLA